MKTLNRIFWVALTLYSGFAVANPSSHQAYQPYPAYGYVPQNNQQDHPNWHPNHWMNQMQDQFIGRNGQGGNIFRDARGFYKLMGDGNTRYKFYFNFDIEMDMNAWMNLQNQANANARARNQAYQAQQRQLQTWQQPQTQWFQQGHSPMPYTPMR